MAECNRAHPKRRVLRHPGGSPMSYEAVRWALYEAPTLLMPSGIPDVAARFVLVTRAERADKNGRDTYAGTADIVRATGYDERTVERTERRLERAGLLIRAGISHLGTVRWHLDMSQKEATGNQALADARIERRRKADAVRQQRARDRRRAAAETTQPIELDVSTKIHVTDHTSVSHGLQIRDVTDHTSGRHGSHAPQTTHEPPRGTTHGTTTGGAPPPDPRRTQAPPAPGTGQQKSPTEPPTPAQDQQGESLPHANARGPSGVLVDFFTREAM